MNDSKFRIAVVTQKSSWIVPYAEKLTQTLRQRGFAASLYLHHRDVKEPVDIVFFLGYGRIVPGEFLSRHRHNLVIHESALPRGKGWSPLSWQILEGKNEIPITLFEAVEKVDSGKIYLQDTMKFEGHELIGELREIQGNKTIELAVKFVDQYQDVVKNAREQEGEESFFSRRRPEDSRLDPDQPIRDQFNLLRVVDNDRYPAFFTYKGHKYVLRISREEEGS